MNRLWRPGTQGERDRRALHRLCRLGKASREELESWTDRVLEAEGLEEVFAAG